MYSVEWLMILSMYTPSASRNCSGFMLLLPLPLLWTQTGFLPMHISPWETKNHKALIGVPSLLGSVFSKRSLVCWWRVQNPFFCIFCRLAKDLQKLFIIKLFYCLTFRHPTDVDDSLNIGGGGNSHYDLDFGFVHPCILIFWGCQTLPIHGLLLGLKIVLENLIFIASNNIIGESLGYFQYFFKMSAQILIWCCFCSGVRCIGTMFARTFLKPRFSYNICLIWYFTNCLNAHILLVTFQCSHLFLK